MNIGTWGIKFKLHYLAVFFLIALVSAAILYLGGGDNERRIIEEQELHKQQQTACNEEERTSTTPTRKNGTVTQINSRSRCNLFSGRWGFDNVSYPLYDGRRCSFMYDDYACDKYGRKDSKYQNWRWQPHDCDLPRFNAKSLLERIRGKKLIYVGDSLNKNMWRSMLCLIEPAISQSSPKSVVTSGNLDTFHASEYNATIGFYWSPLLVESNCDDPDTHRIENRIFRINSIEKHARHWTDADILIFDAFMWWLQPNMTILWGSFGSPDAIYTTIELRVRRLEMTLSTWSNWLELNINRTKTKLFFMSLSPYHTYAESWDEKRSCYNETEPIFKEKYWGISTDRDMMRAVESAVENLETRGLKVEYLNITHLSDYRKDAHPSIYRRFKHPPSEEQLKDPKSYSDCFHWCLPGVPDVWNEILYAYIMRSQ